MTTRTLTVEPREGHFTTRDGLAPRELPGLLRRYGAVLRGTDGGLVNAFGWCNVGIDAYLPTTTPTPATSGRSSRSAGSPPRSS